MYDYILLHTRNFNGHPLIKKLVMSDTWESTEVQSMNMNYENVMGNFHLVIVHTYLSSCIRVHIDLIRDNKQIQFRQEASQSTILSFFKDR